MTEQELGKRIVAIRKRREAAGMADPLNRLRAICAAGEPIVGMPAPEVATRLATARPFVAVKPKGFLNPVIGHYATMRAAQAAAKRFNDTIAKES